MIVVDTLFGDFVLSPAAPSKAASPAQPVVAATPCAQSPDLFDPKTALECLEAKSICYPCPMKRDGSCLKMGRKMKGYGVWGGEFLVEGKKREFRSLDEDED